MELQIQKRQMLDTVFMMSQMKVISIPRNGLTS